jgi:hypothetical protein
MAAGNKIEKGSVTSLHPIARTQLDQIPRRPAFEWNEQLLHHFPRPLL